MKYYPAFIDLKDRNVAVVGGGRVAERKVRTLLKAGARIRVISPSLSAGLSRLKDQGKIVHVKRAYRNGDLRHAFLVIAATSSSETNTLVAGQSPFLVNVADPPGKGNFIVPSTVRRGMLTIAISTGGASPAVSKAIREELEKLYSSDFSRYLRFAEAARKRARGITDRASREKLLKAVASEDMFRTLRREGHGTASRKLRSLFKADNL